MTLQFCSRLQAAQERRPRRNDVRSEKFVCGFAARCPSSCRGIPTFPLKMCNRATPHNTCYPVYKYLSDSLPVAGAIRREQTLFNIFPGLPRKIYEYRTHDAFVFTLSVLEYCCVPAHCPMTMKEENIEA